MKRLAWLTAAALVAATTFTVLSAGPALAHEERTVGPYHFAVGFGDEPAYAGLKNSVQLLADAKDRPVTDLGDTLKVEVIYGSQSAQYPLEPDFEIGEFGTPGDYRAWFIPTRPGTYTFHFFGSIKGHKVEERFTSGPTTFSDVDDPTAVEFPVKDPTVAQVAERLSRELPRLDRGAALAASAEAADAHDTGASARTIAFVSLAVAVIGLAVGAWGLAASRRARARVPASPGEAPVASRPRDG
jgi:hypothetical protein